MDSGAAPWSLKLHTNRNLLRPGLRKPNTLPPLMWPRKRQSGFDNFSAGFLPTRASLQQSGSKSTRSLTHPCYAHTTHQNLLLLYLLHWQKALKLACCPTAICFPFMFIVPCILNSWIGPAPAWVI